MERTVQLEWKTCSVEAGDGFSKPASSDQNRSEFSGFDSGMQKDGLTMFPLSCYSCLVPRVHPGLLCDVSFRRVVEGTYAELLRNAFPVK
jgi:hypothetical protein